MSEKLFSKGDAIKFGWKTVSENLGFFIGLVLIWFLISYIPGYISESFKNTAPLLSFLVGLASNLINIFVSLGIMKISLRFHDQEKPGFEDLFSQGQYFLTYLGAAILAGLAVIGGFILLIIPGIILSIRLQFIGYLIIDKNCGVMESIKKSWAMTKGLTIELLLLGLLLTLVVIAGFLCLIIGLFAAIPVCWIATAYVYRRIVANAETSAVQAAPVTA